MKFLIKITFFISLIIGIFSLLGLFILRNFPEYTTNISTFIPFFISLGSIGFTLLTIICAFLIGIYALGFERNILIFLISVSVSLIMELSSTYNGFPFGYYKYTDLLGPKILNEVPYLIPPSWFSIVVLSYLISKRLLYSGFYLVLVSTIFAFFWDLSLDYAMTKVYPFWIWQEKGFFYDMPIVNWGGWLFTLFIINFLFYILDRPEYKNEKYTTYAFYLYVLIVGFPTLMSLIGGGFFAFLLSLNGIIIIVILSRIKNIKLW